MSKAVTTQADLGKRWGVSQPMVRKFLTRHGFKMKGPWTAAEVKRMDRERAGIAANTDPIEQEESARAALNGIDDDVLNFRRPADSPAQADRLLKFERARLLATRYRRERGDLIDRKEEEARDASNYAAVRVALMALPRQLAARCVGRGEVDIEEILDAGVRSALERLTTSSKGKKPD